MRLLVVLPRWFRFGGSDQPLQSLATPQWTHPEKETKHQKNRLHQLGLGVPTLMFMDIPLLLHIWLLSLLSLLCCCYIHIYIYIYCTCLHILSLLYLIILSTYIHIGSSIRLLPGSMGPPALWTGAACHPPACHPARPAPSVVSAGEPWTCEVLKGNLPVFLLGFHREKGLLPTHHIWDPKNLSPIPDYSHIDSYLSKPFTMGDHFELSGSKQWTEWVLADGIAVYLYDLGDLHINS